MTAIAKGCGGVFPQLGKSRSGRETVEIQRPGAAQGHFRMGRHYHYAAAPTLAGKDVIAPFLKDFDSPFEWEPAT